ncbi:DUF3857 domain-containing protein [uncultured Polaribacter sp.]|uniref:DUF3857 domain-containing protein n=1 Tax=uncultured Polaribacter sp. TaxID=174711 RepID=UPI00262C14CF|nr:DUF3857 domain-containing protein [uncultured Polaribacter sp.]
MKKIALLLLILFTNFTFSQKIKSYFPTIGNVTKNELKMTHYEKDSSANAVVLDEQTFVHFNSMSRNSYYTRDYYVKIKILKKGAFKKANIRIPFYKSSSVKNITGVTYNLNDKNEIVKSLLSEDAIFKEKYNKNVKMESFALPNVKVGSVIEVKYSLSSKSYGLYSTKFQSDIPKIKTTYKAHLPSNPRLKVRIIGFLKPDLDKAYIKDKCLNVYKCTALHYELNNIPPFKEEAYLTTKDNYISRISVEREYNNPYKKNSDKGDWKNLDEGLRNAYDRYSKKSLFYKKNLPRFVLKEKDELRKVHLVHTFIQRHFTKDDDSNNDLQKAFETKIASAININLSLYNALKAAELDNVKMVLLSTRENGFITKLHATILDFDYILVRVVINGKKYYLDATSKVIPFGEFPFECLNGVGRVLDFKNGSYWEDIKPTKATSNTTKVVLSLTNESFNGVITTISNGYKASSKREFLNKYNKESIIEKFESKFSFIEVDDYNDENLTDLSKNLIQNYKITIPIEDGFTENLIRINPFIENKISVNPFKLSERLYPIDFGYKRKNTYLTSLEFPNNYKIKSIPKDKALSLPNKLGKFIFKTNVVENKITVFLKYQLSKEIYDNNEYAYIKEFFNQLIKIQSEDIVLEKKM